MITTKKLLATLIATVLLSICFGTTVFASELDTTVPVQSATEDKNNAVIKKSNIDGQNNETTEADAAVENPEIPLKEGYFIDEQGEVYYIEPSDEPEEIVIEDIIDAEEDKQDSKSTAGKKVSYSEKDLRLLTCLIYSEAGNQNFNGMLGVANVVINRSKSDAYWHVKTIKEVIYDHKWSVQFAVTIKSKSSGVSMLDKALKIYDTRKFTGSNPAAEKKALNRAIKAAKAALEGENNIGNLLCFQNKRSTNNIAKKYSDYKIIADHIFYRSK